MKAGRNKQCEKLKSSTFSGNMKSTMVGIGGIHVFNCFCFKMCNILSRYKIVVLLPVDIREGAGTREYGIGTMS